jgi:hypothetical protein
VRGDDQLSKLETMLPDSSVPEATVSVAEVRTTEL